jgi:ribose 1,5-bisphosphokinase
MSSNSPKRSVRSGRLIYVVGPSGAGKDTLIAHARAQLAHRLPLTIAHRYITRPPHGTSENHIFLTLEEFATRERAGLFAMQWDSNSLRYGIGVEIDQWIAAGVSVLVNGSRGYLPDALQRYPALRLVSVTAPAELLHARLAQRGREDNVAIAARLQRSHAFNQLVRTPELHVVNDGRSEEAGDRLVRYLVKEVAGDVIDQSPADREQLQTTAS